MKKLPIIIILLFSCSVAWGEENKLQCLIPSCKKPIIELLGGFFAVAYCEKHRIEDELTQKRYYSLVVEDFQKEIESLKDRIKELEDNNIYRDGKLGTTTSHVEDDIYYFSGGAGHHCGGSIRNGQVWMNAINCYKCNQSMIDDIKGRHGE